MLKIPGSSGVGAAVQDWRCYGDRLVAAGAEAAAFDQRVWAAVALVPRSRLATYGQIAELIGAWGCARQVGWALRRLPLPSDLPWHRVVNARGCISMAPSREGSDWIQRDRLLAEGIPVDGAGRLPLARHRWLAEGPLPL
jgi:methylated-DNA-protein-cysteine methyltransferase-like protein